MEIHEQIEREQKLATYSGEDQVLPAREVLELYRKDYPRGIVYNSGIPRLDRIIGGFSAGQLITVSGTTGAGKTTLAQSFTLALAGQGVKPLWLSYEVPTDDLLEKFPDDALEYITLPKKLKGNTLPWIEDRLLESKLKYQTRALFIDHLHRLVKINPKVNLSSLIGEIVGGLKQMAIDHRIMLFLMAHTGQIKDDEEPGLGDIRDSSFTEQESDTVFYVWRFKQDKRVTVLKIAKNRRKGIVDERIPLVLIAGRYEEHENTEVLLPPDKQSQKGKKQK